MRVANFLALQGLQTTKVWICALFLVFLQHNNKHMEKYNYKKNDCFLMRGKDINDPMTIYQITDIDENHVWAKSICIKTEMIHGFPIADQYDNSIPDDAIPLPSNSWRWARKQMSSFVKETSAYLDDNIIEEKVDIVIGGHYMYRSSDIATIKEIGEERIKFKVFKIDEDFISPCWKGDCGKNHTERWYAISDETYNEVVRRYDGLLSRLRVKFCGI